MSGVTTEKGSCGHITEDLECQAEECVFNSQKKGAPVEFSSGKIGMLNESRSKLF